MKPSQQQQDVPPRPPGPPMSMRAMASTALLGITAAGVFLATRNAAPHPNEAVKPGLAHERGAVVQVEPDLRSPAAPPAKRDAPTQEASKVSAEESTLPIVESPLLGPLTISANPTLKEMQDPAIRRAHLIARNRELLSDPQMHSRMEQLLSPEQWQSLVDAFENEAR